MSRAWINMQKLIISLAVKRAGTTGRESAAVGHYFGNRMHQVHLFLPWLFWATDVTYMSCVTYMSRDVWVLTANQMMIWGA
jgi:hypothetical protein